MWVAIGVAVYSILIFLALWLEWRDRKRTERALDYCREVLHRKSKQNDDLEEKFILHKRQQQGTLPDNQSPRWKPYHPYHKFLYRDSEYDVWLGERETGGIWKLCILAMRRENVYSYNPVDGIPALSNNSYRGNQVLVSAYHYAQDNDLLPRYDRPYAELGEDVLHFFLGQFHGVDLWYAKTNSDAVLKKRDIESFVTTPRIVTCYPLIPSGGKLRVGYRAITSWDAKVLTWCSPDATAFQTAYDLAAERGLVPKIEHG